jgi:hypothetical protein
MPRSLPMLAGIAAALMIAATPALAKSGYCSDGSKRICRWVEVSSSGYYTYADGQGHFYAKYCHCQSQEAGDDGQGSYGHAEVNKSNVPQLQPNPHPDMATGRPFRPSFVRPFTQHGGIMVRRW